MSAHDVTGPAAPPPAAAQGEGAPVAELHAVTKRYGGVTALDAVDLTVAPGGVLGLLGPNGAGKTTAVSLLAGLRTVDAGTVRIFGGDPRRPASRTRLGMTPQDTGMPDTLKVAELAAWTAAHYPAPRAVDALLDEFGLAGLADRQFGGLSGEQKRRLTVALAFAGDPDLVLLDEPTTGLDVSSRRDLWVAIRGAADAGKTIVLTSHYLEEIEALAHRVVVLGGGRVIADGSMDDIRDLVGLTTVRARLDLAAVADWPLVAHAELVDGRAELLTGDADELVRQLVRSGVDFSGLHIRPASLEDAFLTLTEEGPR